MSDLFEELSQALRPGPNDTTKSTLLMIDPKGRLRINTWDLNLTFVLIVAGFRYDGEMKVKQLKKQR